MSDEQRVSGESILAGDKRTETWWKDAVIYQLHVKSFFDSNNDGVGDFKGLLQKLDYITELGVTAIWLLPFYPSPRRDDGYDIADYYGVSPDYGDMEDVRAFIAAAHERGMRVITELIINHTSDQHPWFQAARSAPAGSPEREFYVWSDDDQRYTGTRIIFLDTEKSNWTWDDEAGAYFWHRFYSHQPDLNFDNPAVLEEVLKVMHFWLDAGVDGLRLDAVPYLIEREGTSNENLPETHEILKKIRADLDAHYPGRLLLAEANMWPEDTQAYFGETGDECHMAFHFPLMPRMYMAVAQEDRFPITDIMKQTPDIPENAQWAIFLRNHDELTLEMVTDEERDYLWNTYAADRRARINLGIRRRLTPLMDRDRRRVELMHALLLSMPGTPVLYYGDEIGMGDNIFLGDRDGVRTPMQWSPDRNGGFSRADTASLVLPPIQDPLYGYDAVNVESQARDGHSLMNWVRRMLAVRANFQAFGRGTLTFVRPRNRKVLVYLREYGDENPVLCVANLSRTAQAVELDLAAFAGRTPVELTGGAPFPAIGALPYLLTLPPYGFYWFSLSGEVEPPDWSSSAPAESAEQHTFVLRAGIGDLFEGPNRSVLERDILPDYVAHRRWFSGKNEAIEAVRVARFAPLTNDGDLAFAEIAVTSGGAESLYVLPFGVGWSDAEGGPFAPNLALARTRLGRRVGMLTDGFALRSFPQAIIAAFRERRRIESSDGMIVFESYEGFDASVEFDVEWLAAEQSNSTLVIGQTMVVKLLRRIAPGRHPEVEMTTRLWRDGYRHVAPIFGEALRIDAHGDSHALMIVQAFVGNQGDAWGWMLDSLSRAMSVSDAPTESDDDAMEHCLVFIDLLGARLAEMHAVLLAQAAEDVDFAPEAFSSDDAAALSDRVLAGLDAALGALSASGSDDPDGIVRWIENNREALSRRIKAVAASAEGGMRTRIHGDLHLGQILVAAGDVVFIDFEGEPARPLEERRAKDSPLRDVAGLIRSFSYAAATAGNARLATSTGEDNRASELFSAFETAAAERFLAAYEKTAPPFAAPLVDLFILEKAAYEFCYEAASRPGWIGIPLAGLRRAAIRLLEAAS